MREPDAADADGRRSAVLRAPQLDAFFGALSGATTRLLMLDYDGTLAPFRMEPHRARPYPGVCELLAEIMASGTTRVVIISGRWVRDLIPLLGLGRLPEIWGSHGRERLRPDGRYEFEEIPPSAMHALLKADAWETDLRQAGGRVERKPASLAIHWRGLPVARIERLRAHILARWDALPGREGLDLRQFDGGIEVVVRGCSKATAVETLLAEAGRGAISAYLGDDLTDEDALGAIYGRGLGVLVSDACRRTAAEAWLRPPQEVRKFLEQWIAACGSAGRRAHAGGEPGP
ncbi:MAG: trehalose-phosphatase [Gammaproteobacteria bacterium]|nr:trehalose-phosphatase [Gammaproteobacteria bacterium]